MLAQTGFGFLVHKYDILQIRFTIYSLGPFLILVCGYMVNKAELLGKGGYSLACKAEK